MFQLVFHINELEKWSMLLSNIQNTTQELNKRKTAFNIAIIANANAVKGYLNPEIREQITTLKSHDNHHIHFFACQNSLTGQEISQTDLNPNSISSTIEIVPVAIIALVEHQNAGFAYIKP